MYNNNSSVAQPDYCLHVHHVLPTRPKNRPEVMRSFIVRIFEAALAMLMTAVFILHIFIWCFAYYHNYIPSGPWGMSGGNHGLWRGFLLKFLGGYDHPLFVLRSTLTMIFGVQFITMVFSAVYLLISNYRRRVLVLLPLNSLYLLVLVRQYAWLID